MKVIYADEHRLHRPICELNRGTLGVSHEVPERAEVILHSLELTGRYDIVRSEQFPLECILRVHSEPYLDFLRSAHGEWVALGRSGDAIPNTWPTRSLDASRVPESLDGRLGFYSFDIGTPITSGTWLAAVNAANVALTAAKHLDTTPAAFALCRPPGHHASRDTYGGYCYFNNAAIATQYLIDKGARRVAILDIDYHHGNGTQSIFYHRDDVLFASIHGDPKTEFPYFLGYESEEGIGDGVGFTVNRPMPCGTGWDKWERVFREIVRIVDAFDPTHLIVSLGVDTFHGDPISKFTLQSSCFPRIGRMIGELERKTVFVMEGGYAVADLGINVEGVLRGFSSVSE